MALEVFSSLLVISLSYVGIAGNCFWLDYNSEDPWLIFWVYGKKNLGKILMHVGHSLKIM